MNNSDLTKQKACEQSNRSNGPETIESLLERFHAFEVEEGLFQRCIDTTGFAWWDIVRYSVLVRLGTDHGIYGDRKAFSRSMAKRASSIVADCLHATIDVSRLVLRRDAKVEKLFVFGRPVQGLLDDLQQANAASMAVAPVGSSVEARMVVRKRSIDLSVRLLSRLLRLPDPVAAEAQRIDLLLKSRFASQSDFAAIIAAKYRAHLASKLLWRRTLLGLPNVSFLGFVNDDTLRSLTALANNAGVVTREYQHGYAGKSHIAYSYPALDEPLGTLPAQLLVSRDTGDITFPVELLFADSPALPTHGEDVERDIDVLIGGSPTRNTSAHYLVSGLVDKGLRLAIKLHPAQTIAASGFAKLYDSGQLSIYDGKADFVELARRSRIYLPANPTSTTVYEAKELGASVAVVDYDGQKMSTAIDDLITLRAATIDELLPALKVMLQQHEEIK